MARQRADTRSHVIFCTFRTFFWCAYEYRSITSRPDPFGRRSTMRRRRDSGNVHRPRTFAAQHHGSHRQHRQGAAGIAGGPQPPDPFSQHELFGLKWREAPPTCASTWKIAATDRRICGRFNCSLMARMMALTDAGDHEKAALRLLEKQFTRNAGGYVSAGEHWVGVGKTSPVFTMDLDPSVKRKTLDTLARRLNIKVDYASILDDAPVRSAWMRAPAV